MRDRIASIFYPYLAPLMAAMSVLTQFLPIQVSAYADATYTSSKALAGVATPAPCASCLPCREPPPIREALAKAEAVFVGKAIEGEKEIKKTFSDGKKFAWISGQVRFSVEWVFNGVKRSEVVVVTQDDPCLGFGPFTKGERYLLYAVGNEDNGFYVERCNRSQLVSSTDEDLKILSGLSPKTCGARLYGMVGYASGIKVTATDAQGKILEAISNEGHFEIEGVRANVEYKVQAHLPDYFQIRRYENPKTVRINPCGWAAVNFSADYDGSISGLVIGPDGNPVENLVVELMSANKTSLWNDMSATSDSQGQFEFRGVKPGEYLLGINITKEPEKNRPYPPTWYPDAATRHSAAVIEMGPGEKLSGYDIVIPRKVAKRAVEGTVFWPDGRPAANADVYLYTSTQQGSPWAKAIYTDDQGGFKVTGYEGIAYYVVARSAPNREEPPVWKWFFAEPPVVELEGENVTGLMLTLTWDEETFNDFFKKQRERQK